LNQDTEIVIIGCGAGGGTAAQFARKKDRKAKITIFLIFSVCRLARMPWLWRESDSESYAIEPGTYPG
jgi:NADH dehydrogenase FAD-containing subunit